MVIESKHRTELFESIGRWINSLQQEKGWLEWQKQKIDHVLFFDEFPHKISTMAEEFIFPNEIEKKHAVVMAYLEVLQSSIAIHECKLYFTRYPFRNNGVQKAQHLSNMCELYFNKFYQFKERVKNLSNKINEVDKESKKIFGAIVKNFGKEFKSELSQRNKIHHFSRFEDIEVSRLSIVNLLSIGESPEELKI